MAGSVARLAPPPQNGACHWRRPRVRDCASRAPRARREGVFALDVCTARVGLHERPVCTVVHCATSDGATIARAASCPGRAMPSAQSLSTAILSSASTADPAAVTVATAPIAVAAAARYPATTTAAAAVAPSAAVAARAAARATAASRHCRVPECTLRTRAGEQRHRGSRRARAYLRHDRNRRHAEPCVGALPTDLLVRQVQRPPAGLPHQRPAAVYLPAEWRADHRATAAAHTVLLLPRRGHHAKVLPQGGSSRVSAACARRLRPRLLREGHRCTELVRLKHDDVGVGRAVQLRVAADTDCIYAPASL